MNTIKQFKLTNLPKAILDALDRQSHRQNYSNFAHLFYAIYLGSGRWCGVAGDGDNGCYDWFVWKDGQLKCSDSGYGSTDVALRDVLNQEVPV